MTGIEVKSVTKRFGQTFALNDVSVSFTKDKIYGLLGRNGAGKSTLINIISNRLFANSGEVFVDGEPAVENDSALQKMYVMGEKTYYPDTMKIKEAFKWTENFYPGFDEGYANALAKQFELNTAKAVRSLSTGYNSIFKIILALSVNTPYVFFDEPVLGLDANHRDLFYRLLIEKYSEKPFTAVISTHLIEEVSGVIEETVIINYGKIIVNETRESLLSKGYTVTGKAAAVDAYIAGKQILGTDSLGGMKSAYLLGERDAAASDGLEFSKLDLQKLFIQLTGKERG